jgi:hypothetical protein
MQTWARRRPAGSRPAPAIELREARTCAGPSGGKGTLLAPRQAGSAVRGTSEFDGFPVACGAGLLADTPGNLAVAPSGQQKEHLGGTDDRHSGRWPGRTEGTGWLPGDFRQADLVTKVHSALAAYHLRWARPGPSCVKQARDPSPHMPVRELGGIRPPVRDLVVSALLPGYGLALHRSPWRTWVLA